MKKKLEGKLTALNDVMCSNIDTSKMDKHQIIGIVFCINNL